MTETRVPALRPGMRYCIEELADGMGYGLYTPDLGSRRFPTWADWCEARGLALPEGASPGWSWTCRTREEALEAVLLLGGRLYERGW